MGIDEMKYRRNMFVLIQFYEHIRVDSRETEIGQILAV